MYNQLKNEGRLLIADREICPRTRFPPRFSPGISPERGGEEGWSQTSFETEEDGVEAGKQVAGGLCTDCSCAENDASTTSLLYHIILWSNVSLHRSQERQRGMHYV